MKRFVFWTGIFNLTTGILFHFPSIARVFMPTENPGMVMHIFASMAIFLGVMLIFCSRDLAARGVLVMWEGILRITGFAIMSGYALVGGAGPRAFSGIIDLILALPTFCYYQISWVFHSSISCSTRGPLNCSPVRRIAPPFKEKSHPRK